MISYIFSNLKKAYNVIDTANLKEAIMSGKMIMGADINQMGRIVRIIPENIFIWNAKKNILEVFTGKRLRIDEPELIITINRELHFADDPKRTQELLQEYIDRFMLKSYDFFYYASPFQIIDKIYPHVPIPHIFVEEARTWLYS